MSKQKIRGKDLKKLNYKSDSSRSLAIEIMNKHYKHSSKEEKLNVLAELISSPEDYKDHEFLSRLASLFLDSKIVRLGTKFELREEIPSYKVYGRKFISHDTLQQMDTVMRLPISIKGALMPDAHVGYGLPIGGVLATKNEIIPYGVGLDIGCRMSLSIYNVPAAFIERNSYKIKTALKANTFFGIGNLQSTIEEHEVLDRQAFREIDILRKHHGKAKGQIGTSGSGNHFVEVGIVQLSDNNRFGLKGGDYVGVLAHSGSRGLGAAIANHYMRIALDTCWLPKGAQHLAWLDLNSEAGQEYWISMNLAGDYAKACHDVIHRKLAKALGLKIHKKVENHHNFAWKELGDDNSEIIVHRKGATPASEDQLGIIPATMMDPGYIVSGSGNIDSICSASHGAGRRLSRKNAKESITGSELKKMLKQAKVTLIGGGVDEAPNAYKNIEEVMQSQSELVKVEGRFYPKIVRMDKN